MNKFQVSMNISFISLKTMKDHGVVICTKIWLLEKK